MRVNASSLHIRAAATSTPGTLNDLTTDLIMANNNNLRGIIIVAAFVELSAAYDTVNHITHNPNTETLQHN